MEKMTEEHIKDIIDFAEPKMDVYEFAIYMYLIRHTRLIGKEEEVFGFKSIRKSMVIGVGESGKPMSEGVCYGRLRTLETKGFIKSISSEHKGTRIRVLYPSEIGGLVTHSSVIIEKEIDIEEMDFFEIPENRLKILERDKWKCFYCFKKLNEDNYVLEHVVSRPEGKNTYRNLVASCRTCNNKKDSLNVNDFLRQLYRDNIISDTELKTVSDNLIKLKNGDLKPEI
ncbi:MAG: HNH endonuclease signature motif containing protein [Bacteroidota bacterium]|nr:HNH endonuclease signature motif containing protein [Bacteroidota bacterium]